MTNVTGGSYNPSRERTFLSTNDLSTKQYYAVALDGSNPDSIVLANAQSNVAIGILVTPPSAAGDTCKVALFGPTTFGVAGAGITKGAALTPDGNGKLVTTTTAAEKVVGIAMETVNSGERIEVMLSGGHYYHA